MLYSNPDEYSISESSLYLKGDFLWITDLSSENDDISQIFPPSPKRADSTNKILFQIKIKQMISLKPKKIKN